MQIRTDLAIEDYLTETAIEQMENCAVSKLELTEQEAKKFNKNGGLYYNITTNAFMQLDYDEEQKVIRVLTTVLKDLLSEINLEFEEKILVVGLGNSTITPDSIGPLVVNNIIVTSHLYKLDQLDRNYRIVSAIAPGVMGQTGIETSDIVSSIVKKEKPKLVIVIDALASRSLKRINKTIQITTSGINPGSGVGNKRKELSKKTLGVDVIAIGVPTVVDIKSVANDIFEFLDDGNSNSVNELKDKFHNNYDEVDTFDFIMTPKEIDENVLDISKVIAKAIDQSLHNLTK